MTNCSSKTISIKVIDDEEYEKNKTFYLEIGEPRLVEMSVADERAVAVAVAERTGLDADADLLPALLAAVVTAALRVSLLRWQTQGGTTPLTALADEALDAVAAGLPAAH